MAGSLEWCVSLKALCMGSMTNDVITCSYPPNISRPGPKAVAGGWMFQGFCSTMVAWDDVRLTLAGRRVWECGNVES